jgi:hypothetical protein
VYEKVAATYFPAYYRSIIGAEGLNYSVRDGKRWTPSLKPPSMSFCAGRGIQRKARSLARCVRGHVPGNWKMGGKLRVISSARLSAFPRLHLHPINQVVFLDPCKDISSWGEFRT